MGERKGTNKYYPPDFDPAKHGSLNKYHHSHPLRERARKLAQGILVIRFEMPFNIWCDGCKNHIGMGVRYNAEKKKVGTYYTTPIYRFRMRCHLCAHPLELQTDPAGCDYVIVSGARRKEERWDMGDNGQVLPTAREAKEKLEADAMFRLEHGVTDRATLQRAVPTLATLQLAQSAWKDDFALNSRLRQRFREEKRTLREEEEEVAALQARAGLSVPLLREDEADRRLAALLKYHSPHSYEEKQRMKRAEISKRSWFPSVAGGGKLGLGGRVGPPHTPTPTHTPTLTPTHTPTPTPTPAGFGIIRRRCGEGAAGAGGAQRGELNPQSKDEAQGGVTPHTAPPVSPPVPPHVSPDTPGTAPPVSPHVSPDTPGTAPPVSPPVSPHVSPDTPGTAPPVSPPVSPHVSPDNPGTAPPVSPHVTPHVAPQIPSIAPPVSPPTAPLVAPPVSPQIPSTAPSVSPPVSPDTPGTAPPVAPPTAPPTAPPVPPQIPSLVADYSDSGSEAEST